MVETKSIETLFRESPFFQSFQYDHISLLAKCSEVVHFNQNELLLTEGENADCFYLILNGSVAIESHFPGREALVVSKVATQGIVGFSWLFPPYRNQFDARAVISVSAVKLSRDCLLPAIESDHALGYHLLKGFSAIMLQRMQSARRQMLDIFGQLKKIP